ncbi:unnamed protein product [Lactuca virosa]|uniref:Uncharacterized protein n=1 Tax=Lactuca virosa TaxID=75947 RepID=A0AAU9PHL8_9ASTR|nr:unnamed protein product [Lactuca virosa]
MIVGVVLLELITGRKLVDGSQPGKKLCVVTALDSIVEFTTDLSNGMKPGQSEIFDSREQSAHRSVKRTTRMLNPLSLNRVLLSQIDVGNKKAVVIHVPYRLRKLIGYEPVFMIEVDFEYA